jgi:glycosyltransferase involved in cell wall biosynthesis
MQPSASATRGRAAPMRVVHVVPGLSMRTGGLAVAVVESAVATERLGVSNCVLATDIAGPPASNVTRPVPHEDLPRGLDEVETWLAPASWPLRFAYSRALDRRLAAEVARADLVRIHSLFLFPQFAAFRHAIRNDVPYLVSPHGALDPFLRRRGRARKRAVSILWQDRMLGRAAALHLTSDDEARLVADIAPSVPRIVLANGIWWDDFQRLPDGREFRARYLGGHGGDIVLSLGRITHKKGLDILVRSFAEVRARHPGAVLAMAGPDDEGLQPSLAALATRLGIGDSVIFTGMLNGDDRLDALAAATVWALPSHTENFGIAAVEALAAGVPVVISPAVNIAPDVGAAGAAIVVDAQPAALARALSALLDDAARRTELGERGRLFARRYDWSHLGGRLAEAYEAVCRRARDDA